MINGTHILLYSTDADADREFIRDMLGFKYVEAHPGWLIFKTPVAEAGVHPLESPDAASMTPEPGMLPAVIWLMCDDIEATRAELKQKGVETAEPTNEGRGTATKITLPSGAQLGIYQPHHPVATEL